eukprot:TRINITY_DN24121_c0_g1_i1.p1 TRINITY_DN24121_c0_g1~~TRINITY_DN24121_c0_g1_i1.p1  ORF type:complete len:1726 (+),score=253.18 TRINITY_DN24121_c0_g1_i1:168-5180(+)
MEALDRAKRPDAYLEIGASATLMSMAKRFLRKGGEAAASKKPPPAWLPSLDPKAGGDVAVFKKSEEFVGAVPLRPSVAFKRQSFPWREVGHPLLRRRTNRPDGSSVYSCPIDGHVLELLSHHIVHGEVVVPGACYLEMIIAGAREYLGRAEAWCVEDLGFAKPLVLRLVEGRLEEATELRLSLWSDGRLEVESEVGSDPEESIVTTHVEATLVRQAGGWPQNRPTPDSFDLHKIRASCDEQIDIDLMYSFGVDVGLPLQRRFRAVREARVQKSELRGVARLEMERDGTESGFLLGPSVIDSTFQALMSLADPAIGLGSLKIPLSIKRLQPTGRAFSIGVWSQFQLQDYTNHSTVFRACLMNDSGEVLIHFDHVHLQEVRDEHIQKVLAAAGRKDVEQESMYTIDWQLVEEQNAVDDEAHTETQNDTHADVNLERYLVFGPTGAALLNALEKDARCRCIGIASQQSGADESPSVDLLEEHVRAKPWESVIFLGGVAEDAEDVTVLGQSLRIVQASVRNRALQIPPLLLLTRGSQPLASVDLEDRRRCSPLHAGLWGFARAVRMEYPEEIRLSCLDLDSLDAEMSTSEQASTVLSGVIESLRKCQEEEIALRGGGSGGVGLRVPRLRRSSVKARGPLRLNMPARGALTNLRPVPQAGRRVTGLMPNYVLVRVRAVGLNFRDVLNVMGVYPGDPGPPGADFAGTVLEVGEGVEHVRVGDDVFGEAPGCLSTYHVAPAPLLTRKPVSWSFEEACTMPVIFVTVEEALNDLARLQPGERLLVHAAAGGVGLVAIQYAQYIGAEVFATAGAEEKHEYLRSLGVKYITSSRNGDRFARDMQTFFEESGASGVDVVLNCFSHDDYIPRSVALLRQGGRFLEIGKIGTWSPQRMWEARPDVLYERIAIDTMMEKEPWTYNGYLQRLLQRVDEGGLRPIHMHIFDGLERGVNALQFLQRAQNIGKVVITEPSRMGSCCSNLTTLLSGGMGALGIVLAQFLVEEGSKSLCLTSRSGMPADGIQSQWEWLQASAVTVNVQRCDVSQESEVSELRKALPGPVAGLLHLAGILADGMIPSLEGAASFRKSYGPKVHGLHHLCSHLNFESEAAVLLFSSTSALFGSPGQANYSAANSVLDSIAPHWSALGKFRARSVQWGPWAEVGMAVQKGTIQRTKASGLGALGPLQGRTILGSVLAGAESLVGAAHVHWSKFLRLVFSGGVPAFLSGIAAEARRTEAASGKQEVVSDDKTAALAALSSDDRLVAVRETILRIAREVVDDEELEVDAALLESGMDSLSGVEFRNRLLGEFGGIRIPNSAVFDYPTVTALAEFVSERLASRADPSGIVAHNTLSSVAVTDAMKTAENLPEGVSGASQIFERLNDRAVGQALFLVPGAGMQSASFRALAAMLPLPVYGASWPKGAMPQNEWPTTVTELAEFLLVDVLAVCARDTSSGNNTLLLAGHSFGASVCREMARLATARGKTVSLVVLLDPRNLPPVTIELEAIFKATGLVDTLAMLAVLSPDGSRYISYFEEAIQLPSAAEQEAFLERKLAPAAFASLLHVHATSTWYASLLGRAEAKGDVEDKVQLTFLLRSEESWLSEPTEGISESPIGARLRTSQVAIFQSDSEVSERVPGARRVLVPGGHFGMLQEPHVAVTALHVCHALVEAGVADLASGGSAKA